MLLLSRRPALPMHHREGAAIRFATVVSDGHYLPPPPFLSLSALIFRCSLPSIRCVTCVFVVVIVALLWFPLLFVCSLDLQINHFSPHVFVCICRCMCACVQGTLVFCVTDRVNSAGSGDRHALRASSHVLSAPFPPSPCVVSPHRTTSFSTLYSRSLPLSSYFSGMK
jgi:hypothetical protein